MPKWISGEPTQTEINAYEGPITMPAAPTNEAYPNLADVPPRPKPTLDAAGRAAEMADMKKQNQEGQAAIQQFNGAKK